MLPNWRSQRRRLEAGLNMQETVPARARSCQAPNALDMCFSQASRRSWQTEHRVRPHTQLQFGGAESNMPS